MPETLPTVTSSTITGEFCGRVATSARLTVIEYEPGPWPAVPGSATVFNPPNWQPASSAPPAANALPRNQICLIVRVPVPPVAAHQAPARRGVGPAADRRIPSQARAYRAPDHWSAP